MPAGLAPEVAGALGVSNDRVQLRGAKGVKQGAGSFSSVASKMEQKLSQRTREGMQSALDTLMKKWMDAVETKDEKIKHDFRGGLEKLVKNSAEENS